MSRLFDRSIPQYLITETPVVTIQGITLACFFNTNDVTVTQTIMGMSRNSTGFDGFWLVLRGAVGGDPLWAQEFNGSSANAETTSGVSVNTWHHGCAVFAATNDRRIYLDGGSKGTDSANRSVPSGLDNTTVGSLKYNNGTDDDDPFSGMVAEVGIWNVALTDTEVLMLSLGYSPLLIRPQNLVFYVPLVRDNDNDLVGGLSLTPTNGPTVSPHPAILNPYTPHNNFFVTAGGIAYQKSLSESVGITDTLTTSAGYAKSISDTAGITDALLKAVGYKKSIMESVSVTDLILKSVSYVKSIFDNVGITDLISKSVGYIVSLSSTVGVTGVISRSISYIKSISDNVGITDSINAFKIILVTIYDTVGVTDVLSTIKTIGLKIPRVIGTITKYFINAVMEKYKIIGTVSKYMVMSEGGNMEIKKGNTMILDFALTDGDGTVITTLSSAQTIVFQLKETKTGAALIEKDLSDGIIVDRDKLNNVLVGSIRVEAPASETDTLTADSELFVAVEVTWANNNQEVYIKEDTVTIESFSIDQDIIQ
jgi:hypothetical protein